jgi:hypothetical protein
VSAPADVLSGPTAADLAAIEAEWPQIEAELAVLDAEIRALSVAGGPSPLDWRRLRRAERRALAALLESCRAAHQAARGEAERRAWVLADRSSELGAWHKLYNVLYPPPASEPEEAAS